MRIRTLKPEFWSHPVMVRQSDATKLLAVGLLNYADDQGYFYAEPAMVRAALRPLDEDSTIVRRSLDDLSRIGYLEIGEHPTHGVLGKIVAFETHQRVDRPNKPKIKHLWDSTIIRRSFDANVSRELGNEGTREQGNKGTREAIVLSGGEGSGGGQAGAAKEGGAGEERGYHRDARTVLFFLNEASGRRYRETSVNLGFISERLSEDGVDLAGIKLMVSRQCALWKGTDMEHYLRPETLFNKTKFDAYYAAKDLPATKPGQVRPAYAPEPHNPTVIRARQIVIPDSNPVPP